MEDDYSVEKLRIAKLAGPNYRPWSIQVQRLLLSNGLWNVVRLGMEVPTTGTSGSGAEPASGGSGKASAASSAAAGASGSATEPAGPVVDTQKLPAGPMSPTGDRTEVKDAKASTIIMGLCASGTLQHILLLFIAKEQWEALKALYSPLGLQ